MKNCNNTVEKSIVYLCSICGEVMKENVFAYDNNVHGKIHYKCENCGHKLSIIK